MRFRASPGGQPLEHANYSRSEREGPLWIAEGRTYWETEMIIVCRGTRVLLPPGRPAHGQ